MTCILAMIVLYSFTLIAFFFFQESFYMIGIEGRHEVEYSVCTTMMEVRSRVAV
jgi:hypothetical protein